MRSELVKLRTSLDQLYSECLAIKAELKFRALTRALKANFDPDQPRDKEGQWTDGSSAFQAEVQSFIAHQVEAIFADAASLPLADRISQFLGDSAGDSSDPVLQSVGVTISYDNALTGIQSIDDTTVRLSNLLDETMSAMDFIPEQSPGAYGVAVHVSFANAVRASNLEGIGQDGVEQSFLAKEVVRYGIAGSIRTDITMSDSAGRILAIYDVKTGGAVLSPSRADKLRTQSGAGAYTPVIELHFQRGASLKHESVESGFSIDTVAIARHVALRRHSRRGAY